MKRGRPPTGRKGRPVNIYLPDDVLSTAKRRFTEERGISLSEGVKTLLVREFGRPAKAAKAAA